MYTYAHFLFFLTFIWDGFAARNRAHACSKIFCWFRRPWRVLVTWIAQGRRSDEGGSASGRATASTSRLCKVKRVHRSAGPRAERISIWLGKREETRAGSEGIATTGNTTTPCGPARSIVTTLLEQREERWRMGRLREKEGRKGGGMRQIAKRSHHAISVPFLSSLARFSFLLPFLGSPLPRSVTCRPRAAMSRPSPFRRLSDAIRRTTPSSIDDLVRAEFMATLYSGTRARSLMDSRSSATLLSVLYRAPDNLVRCCFIGGEQFPPSPRTIVCSAAICVIGIYIITLQ